MLLIGSFLAFGLPYTAHTAAAATPSSRTTHHSTTHHTAAVHASAKSHHTPYHHTASHTAHASAHGRGKKVAGHGRVYARSGGISCVPYARRESGIDIPGNAWQWWDNAAGVYARGNRPEAGSVLSFTANGRMRLGHVAVVAKVINPREIEVDHANWWGPGQHGGIGHDIPVVDVSENNDWTAVRVGLGHSGEFGSVYPTNGFIYDRPDTGHMVAAIATPAPQPVLNPAPSDLRPYAERVGASQPYDEVAEAPPVHAPLARHHTVHHATRHR